jgi:hypothetical protein
MPLIIMFDPPAPPARPLCYAGLLMMLSIALENRRADKGAATSRAFLRFFPALGGERLIMKQNACQCEVPMATTAGV